MNWQEGIAVVVVLLGLGAGAFLVAQHPSRGSIPHFGCNSGCVSGALLPRAVQYL